MAGSEMILLDADLLTRLSSPSHPRLLVGYSGGMDSHVLLHQIVAAGLKYKCAAIHVNHGISPYADQWQAHCQQVCAHLEIDIKVVKLQLSSAGNLEAEARRGRYEAYAQAMQSKDMLLLGHHQDDQIETALFYLLRGSGRAGLQGMPATRELGAGELVRPLLSVSHRVLQAYAQEHELCWVEDDSNQDQRLTRNYLRQHVIPELESRWPGVKATLGGQLQRDAQARALLDELASADLKDLLLPTGGLRVAGMAALSLTRQKNLLGFWLADQQLPYPSSVQLDQALPSLLANAAGAVLRWQDISLVRFRECLYLLRPLPSLAVHACRLTADAAATPLSWQGGIMSITQRAGEGLAIDDLSQLVVRPRSGGETLYRGQRQAVKKLLAARHVPVWLRDRLPLIYFDDELVAIAGLPSWNVPALVHRDYEARADALGWLCEFHISDRYG